ncbi:flagellar basal-body MS-ring/collar protein FliF [Falsibacillus albus]|uniref:Flagellar M-ring protein n=1 Tax=Falsibacillus albus TaxID=2478915 RepID=A0A3L7JXY7_9BACI|nr:flagellar basal-body MS-ring/collar protein FliF [Falsibacillus albus]RLQ95748.1 flagellar basal body M-ring protein FliF [Falsibacillus albus]
MNETLQNYLNKIKRFWAGRSKNQKTMLVGSLIFLVVLVSVVSYFATRETMVPLYSNLSASEAGSIKENLDGKGIHSEVADGGTTIKVPAQDVDTLKVQLASEGIPKSGSIDYSFFSQNAGFGMTDNEFDVLKLDAMQTELANLIKGIDGVNDAKVMINLPDKGIFVSDQQEKASASIVLNTKYGFQMDQKQIKSLYHLVSKSVPNLPTDNIVIMNQYFEYFEMENEDSSLSGKFAQQMDVKKQIEKDIQRQVQNMLGTLVGFDKVVVSVSADIDFTQENREENLVSPVDQNNLKGIEVSAKRITETFSGKGAVPGGSPTSETTSDTPTYQGSQDSNGDYERKEETINNEVNKVRKQIVESPYKVRDLGIQVMVEPPNPKDPASLPQGRVDDIKQILSTIIRTTVDKDSGTDLTQNALQDKVVVSVQPFNGKIQMDTAAKSVLPWWVYVVGGILLAIIVLLFLFLFRSRKKEEISIEEEVEPSKPIYVQDVNQEKETESTVKRKQLEKMAKDKPEEFAKLLRTWLAED